MTASPLPVVRVTYSVERRLWTLVDDYVISFEKWWFRIPSGFVCDLANVPRLLWWVIGPHELGLVAPLIHDALYRYRGALPLGWTLDGWTCDRKEADVIFHRMMLADHVPAWKARLAYRAVRIFGSCPLFVNGGSWE